MLDRNRHPVVRRQILVFSSKGHSCPLLLDRTGMFNLQMKTLKMWNGRQHDRSRESLLGSEWDCYESGSLTCGMSRLAAKTNEAEQ